MGSLGDYLMEELSLKTSFTIPIGGGIPVPQSAVTTWVIMAIVVLLCIIFVRNLKVIPEGPQVYVEALVGFIYNFIGVFDFTRAIENARNTSKKEQRTA